MVLDHIFSAISFIFIIANLQIVIKNWHKLIKDKVLILTSIVILILAQCEVIFVIDRGILIYAAASLIYCANIAAILIIRRIVKVNMYLKLIRKLEIPYSITKTWQYH